MNKELSFWKYKDESIEYRHNAVYDSLCDGKRIADVATLPIDEIRMKIDDIFFAWIKFDKNNLVFNDEVIVIYTTDQLVRFDCYRVSEDNMNNLIDIMREYDCKLYDASIDVRFD